MNKKADMSMRVIAGAILILIVLGVLIYIFTQNIGESSKTYESLGKSAGDKAKEALDNITSFENILELPEEILDSNDLGINNV